MFVECSIAPDVLLQTLNQSNRFDYHYAPGIGCRRVHVFTRFSREFVPPVFETDRLTIRHLRLPARTDILLAVVHFPSKLHWDEQSQALECTQLADLIRREEENIGHSRTVLVGDLNMNPFEAGVVGARGLHGVMCRRIAERRARVVQGTLYPFFYNPMWSLLGDASPGPPGTYYRGGSEHVVFFWNMFDQVLIRPELLQLFSGQDLEILQSDGATSLVSASGLPDCSDHLPILFSLRL